MLTGLVGGSASAATHAGVAPATASVPAAAAATTARRSARWGAGYLARQITANGGFVAPFGRPTSSNTAFSVLGLHAAGVGGTASGQAIAWLKTQVATGMAGSDGQDDPGRLGLPDPGRGQRR